MIEKLDSKLENALTRCLNIEDDKQRMEKEYRTQIGKLESELKVAKKELAAIKELYLEAKTYASNL